jgi:uncharacterized damage-inducible protein DinB
MTLQVISELLLRELSKIRAELERYSSEDAIWETSPGISNSAGTLALHVAGNLQHFIGSVLGGTDYVRNREFEFSAHGLPLKALLNELVNAELAVKETLDGLDPGRLELPYPIEVFGKPMNTEWFLLHLVSHASYHLGQINYHRRTLLD